METKFYFARRCDVTGRGMNEGYCFGDGEAYALDESDALKIAQQMGYASLNEAYDDGAYMYTDWYDDSDADDITNYVSDYEDGRDAVEVY